MSMMQDNIFCWNLRGLNNSSRRNEVKKWSASSKPSLGAFLETHVSEQNSLKIMQDILPGWRLHANYSSAVNGRIWVVWDATYSVIIYHSDEQKVICGILNLVTMLQFTAVFVYAASLAETRTMLWEEIKVLGSDSRLRNQPWVILGDFNQVLMTSEHYSDSYSFLPSQGMREFQGCLSASQLFDLPFCGGNFTWTNKQAINPIARKLDRALITEEWLLRFPNSYAVFEASEGSDHARCMVYLDRPYTKPKPYFKYYHFLASQQDFLRDIKDSWSSVEVTGSRFYCFIRRMRELKAVCRKIGNNQPQNIQSRTKSASEELLNIQNELLLNPSVDLFQKEIAARTKWKNWEKIEESFLKQKSRVKWLDCGDANSKYFHRAVLSRRSINTIRYLIGSEGERITDPRLLKTAVVNYYKGLLGTQTGDIEVKSAQELCGILTYRCSEIIKADLQTTPTPLEIRDIIFHMPTNRAPGPDGFPIDFYRDAWEVVGEDLISAVTEFFESGRLLKEINTTAITLIPKVKGADRITEFRPISCCNAVYKVISTILSRKLSSYLPQMVQKNQAGFVKGRSLQENILLASELVVNYNKNSSTQRGVLKIDLAKAYDNINWDFLLNILRSLDIPLRFINWVQECVTSPTYSVNLNGELVGFFPGAKGLRQGDLRNSDSTWLPHGILLDLVGSSGPAISGIPINATVNQAIIQDRWIISNSRNSVISRLRSHLPNVPPLLNSELQDEYRWKSSISSSLTKFSARHTWLLSQQTIPLVNWYKAIWFKQCTPKHAFNAWIVAWKRLPTRDRLRSWGLIVPNECPLCLTSPENLDHLIVNCTFAQELWCKTLSRTNGHGQNSVSHLFDWALKSSTSQDLTTIDKLIVQSTIYEIWAERNARIHGNQHRSVLQIVAAVQSYMRSKLLPSFLKSVSRSSDTPLLQHWFSKYQS